jgi:hypothetical protein
LNSAGGVSPQTPDRPITSDDPSSSSQPPSQELVGQQDQASTDGDRALIARIRTQAVPLIGAPDTGWPVHFISTEGKVTIVGHVPTVADQQRLRALVQQTPGVIDVTDTLRVAGNTSPPQAAETPLTVTPTNTVPGANANVRGTEDTAYTAMDEELVIRLRRSLADVFGVAPAASPVHFNAKEGLVTLTGFVLSEQQRQRVMDVVKRTPGVASVDNQLQVSSDTGAVASQESLSTNSVEMTPTSRSNSPARVYPGEPDRDTPRPEAPAPAKTPDTR